MPTGHVFIATSLDGFVARKDHRLDWLMRHDASGEEHGFDEFMASVDGLVMGRHTFETVIEFDPWPYSKPVIVLSQTLSKQDVPTRLSGRVEISSLEPRALFEKLDADGWSRVYVDAGAVVQSFIRLGLVESIVLTQVPILIGEGISLFGTIESDIDLELLGSKSFESGMVQSHYRLKQG